MKQVNTKSELANAIKAGEKHIICSGDAASALLKECARSFKSAPSLKKHNRRKMLLAVVICLASLAAVPLTAGTSFGIGTAINGGALAGVTSLAGLGAITSGLTIGSITMTTRELMVICGTLLTNKALNRSYKIHFKNGFVNIDAEPTIK